ncbi:ciliary microtubule-associated protein 3-like isoform X2 [Pseudochaenichthys georgianus]|uniref:ciliary microtubule-associated protein 3-like isoform X2 n=1 Tax=Pseudochaenichthys georgianus TaxID=52239 RepID=UPI00146F0320|nr:protein pitchfork-like isoform X2 [Pseudochaenichthys georgianus]
MSEAPIPGSLVRHLPGQETFPGNFAPDRLGNHMARPEVPHIGPGSYDNHEYGTIVYDLQKTPGSKKGYSLSARTAARFPPCSQTATPSPLQYQQDQSYSRVPPPGKTPFASTTPRPGTYAHDAVTDRKVSWPMCFGSPDWSRLPQIEKKSLRVKLHNEKEFMKHRRRVAYLSLYY